MRGLFGRPGDRYPIGWDLAGLTLGPGVYTVDAGTSNLTEHSL